MKKSAFGMSLSLILTAVFSLAFAQVSRAQAPGTPVQESAKEGHDQKIIDQALALKDAGKLLKAEQVSEQLAKPQPAKVELPPPSVAVLRGREVAGKARAGFVQIGYCYLCKKCDHWHLNLAGGYAITSDVVASCQHVVKPGDQMREGYLIAVDSDQKVRAVTAVLAAEAKMDTAILRVEGEPLQPLSLQPAVAVGDPAYCYSFPLGQRAYFSDGIVNRFYHHKKTR
jgi:hypothetical protein